MDTGNDGWNQASNRRGLPKWGRLKEMASEGFLVSYTGIQTAICPRLHFGGTVYFYSSFFTGSHRVWVLPVNMLPISFCARHSFLFVFFCHFVGGEGSAETGQKETSTCDICQFGAECDVDAEDVWWVKSSFFFPVVKMEFSCLRSLTCLGKKNAMDFWCLPSISQPLGFAQFE